MSKEAESKNSSNEDASSPAEPRSRESALWPWVVRHKLLSVVVVFLLAALVHYLSVRPIDNPQPKKSMFVQGSFPYDKGWDLKIMLSYYSRNPTCRQTARVFFLFPQAEVSRQAWRTVPVIRQEGNRYRFEFYEDALRPGVCDWQLRFVNYVITQGGREIMSKGILGFPSHYNTIRYSCTNSSSIYYKAPDRTPVMEIKPFCHEGDNRWKIAEKTDYQIDFIWEEKGK